MTLVFILIGAVIVLLTIISTNIRRKVFNMATSIFTAIFAFIAIIAFWYFIYRGDVYDNWYPLLGHAIAAHGAFIGIILWQITENRGITLGELFKSIGVWFKNLIN